MRSLVLVLTLCTSLAACGGGGGGGGGALAHTSSWRAPVLIEADDSGSAVYPQIAIDADGNAWVVWEQFDGTYRSIWANRYTANSGWGTARLIENNAGDAHDPQITIDAGGNALAVWVQYDGKSDKIWANHYAAGSGWGVAMPIENNAGNARYPQIAVDAGGNAWVVWEQFDGTRTDIWANRYAAGSGWGVATPIETNVMDNAFNPQIAVDAGGNAVVVWEQAVGTRTDIWANRYTAGSGWGTARLIETQNAGSAAQPRIAIDANGNALVVWLQFTGTRADIWANRYTAGSNGSWDVPTLIETDDAGNTFYPHIAVDASGNALAVWTQSDGTRYNIWANRYTAGAGWGTATLIETDNAGDAFDPQIAFDANGNALAVWEQWDGTRYNIWANRYE